MYTPTWLVANVKLKRFTMKRLPTSNQWHFWKQPMSPSSSSSLIFSLGYMTVLRCFTLPCLQITLFSRLSFSLTIVQNMNKKFKDRFWLFYWLICSQSQTNPLILLPLPSVGSCQSGWTTIDNIYFTCHSTKTLSYGNLCTTSMLNIKPIQMCQDWYFAIQRARSQCIRQSYAWVLVLDLFHASETKFPKFWQNHITTSAPTLVFFFSFEIFLRLDGQFKAASLTVPWGSC